MPDSPAIRHALARLNKARDALDRLKLAATLIESESAWSDLLLAGNGVYSKLEQGSKVNGHAQAWYGRAKRERKDDALLSYMHQARNTEEHGIEDVTQRMKAGDGTITIREPFDPKNLEGLQLTVGTDRWGRVRLSSSDERVVTTRMYDKPDLQLVAVRVIIYFTHHRSYAEFADAFGLSHYRAVACGSDDLGARRNCVAFQTRAGALEVRSASLFDRSQPRSCWRDYRRPTASAGGSGRERG